MKYHRHKQQSSQKKTTCQDKKSPESFLGKENVEAYTLSTNAKGIAKLENGTIVFVDNLLPKEKAVIKILSEKSTYKKAIVLQREQDSPERAIPPCAYYYACGGCQIQHIKPEKQIEYKIQWFFETLKRIGKWNDEIIKQAAKNSSIVYLKSNHYRRRIRLHFDGKNLGFKEESGSKIIAVEYCYIARPKLNEKLKTIKGKLQEAYDKVTKEFSLPRFELNLEVTESDDGKIIFNLVNFNFLPEAASSEKQGPAGNRVNSIKEIFNKLLDIQSDQLIHIKHPFLGKFKLKKESFIQPHYDSLDSYCENISDCIKHFFKLLTNKKKLSIQDKIPLVAWDLYAGSGVFSYIPYYHANKFGIPLNGYAVEGVQEAIDSLILNYKDTPIQSIVQDVHVFIDEQFAAAKSKANIIILDPPRSGVGITSMQKIVELLDSESCILYLACDPASFARDTRILIEGGFQNKRNYIFDSFGQTNFYEVLGFFVKGV